MPENRGFQRGLPYFYSYKFNCYKMKVKYIRWSTLGQSAARQLLDNNKYDLILQEQISGSIAFAKRPKGAELLKLIEAGKVSDISVEEFSRLGRNAFDT